MHVLQVKVVKRYGKRKQINTSLATLGLAFIRIFAVITDFVLRTWDLTAKSIVDAKGSDCAIAPFNEDSCLLGCSAVEMLAASIIRAITLMMEAARTSETSINFYQTTRLYNQEDSHLSTRRRENLKSIHLMKFKHTYDLFTKLVTATLESILILFRRVITSQQSTGSLKPKLISII
jgi:hypothetical protein